jgi:putative tryptophan/tyrosine transport system substrate-binding protein
MRRRAFGMVLGALATASTGWPSPIGAQQKPMAVVGFLNAGEPGRSVRIVAAFREGLGEIGYLEGQNLTIEYRWAEGRYDRLPALAADLVGRKVDLIAVSGSPAAASAAKGATSTIPVVFIGGDSPVADGLVASLARPGGNLTGVSSLVVELNPKRFELLRELVPQARVIAMLVNPNNPASGRLTREAQDAARTHGVQLVVLNAGNDSEIDAAFAALAQRQAGALIVATDPFFTGRNEQVTALAARHGIPAIYGWPEFTMAGGLISYGPSRPALYRQIGIYAGKILKGAKPADLPVLQPAIFELVVNMRTARTLGLTVPPSILARADEVIE